MSFGTTRVAAFYDVNPFKYTTGGETALTEVLDGTKVPLNSDGRRVLVPGTVMVYVGSNEVQTWTITGTPTGGTFTPTVQGTASAPVAYNATAADLQAKLRTALGTDAATVSGSAGGPYTVTFGGALAGVDVTTSFAHALTGGSSPNIGQSTVTAGGSAPAKGQKIKPAPSSGVAAADVAGILRFLYEAYPEVPESYKNDRAVAVWALDCHFKTGNLTGYSGNSTAVKAAMTGAGNGNCANCTFRA